MVSLQTGLGSRSFSPLTLTSLGWLWIEKWHCDALREAKYPDRHFSNLKNALVHWHFLITSVFLLYYWNVYKQKTKPIAIKLTVCCFAESKSLPITWAALGQWQWWDGEGVCATVYWEMIPVSPIFTLVRLLQSHCAFRVLWHHLASARTEYNYEVCSLLIGWWQLKILPLGISAMNSEAVLG